MPNSVDDQFYDRADEHIHLSNRQIKDDVGAGKVSASMMYSTSRFNAWLSACRCESDNQMRALRDENIEYFVAQFRLMLEENYDDYVNNFEDYMEHNSSK